MVSQSNDLFPLQNAVSGGIAEASRQGLQMELIPKTPFCDYSCPSWGLIVFLG